MNRKFRKKKRPLNILRILRKKKKDFGFRDCDDAFRENLREKLKRL